MARLLIIAGALIAFLGIVLIPLPDPGSPLLILGAIVLLAGAAFHVSQARGPRRTS